MARSRSPHDRKKKEKKRDRDGDRKRDREKRSERDEDRHRHRHSRHNDEDGGRRKAEKDERREKYVEAEAVALPPASLEEPKPSSSVAETPSVESNAVVNEELKEEKKTANGAEQQKETQNVDGDEPLLVDPFITFTCHMCNFEEKCLYNELRVADGFYPQPVFYLRDPFKPPVRVKGRKPVLNDFLVLGSTCHLCNLPVCFDKTCSVYFGNHFCANCILREQRRFPTKVVEILNKVQEAKKKKAVAAL